MDKIEVIILVGREERHIGRCLERLRDLNPRRIFVVESQKGDRTHEIAVAGGAETVWHDWPGTQAEQFNWALDNLPLEGEWILRLDADEYLTEETIARLRMPGGLADVADDVAGLTLELKRRFMGGEIRHASNGIRQVRLFRRGRGRYAEGLMDERLEIDGPVMDFPGAFYDDSLIEFADWQEKHRGYAKREAAQAVASMRSGVWTDPRKAAYYRLPRYLRAIAYFCVRYFLKGGFLDGVAGWRWNFWQGLWYRWLVDRELGNVSKFESFKV